MYPWLTIGSPPHTSISTYFLCFSSAVCFLYCATREQSRRQRIDLRLIDSLFFWALFGGFIGARGFYLAFENPTGSGNVLQFLSFWNGGLTLYGGIAGASGGVWAGCRFYRAAFWPVAQASCLPALIAIAIGRVGCLLAGCCYGKPTNIALAVPHRTTTNTGLEYVHASALYEAVMCVLLALVLRRASPERRLWLAIIGYVTVRFGVEFTRGDIMRGFLGPLSYAQWISLTLLAVTAVTCLAKSVSSSQRLIQITP